MQKRRKARTEPRAAKHEWHDIFQAIGHPSFILKPDHSIIACNKAVVALTGKPAEYFVGKKCCDVFHKRENPPENCPMEKLLRSVQFETVEMEMEALDRTFLVSCTPVLNKSGKLSRIIHIATDITEHKQAERRLCESEGKFRTMFESDAEGILVADVKKRQFKYANPAICRMLGYTQAELTSMGVNDIHPPESMGDVISHFKSHGRGEKTSQMDLPCRRKDGTIFYVHIAGTKGIIDGEECNIGFFTDVTDIRRTREALREERDRAKKYFDIAAVIFLVIDTEGRVTLINKKGCEILGFDESRIIGKNWFESFVPEKLRDGVKAVFKNLMSGKIEPAEYYENPVLKRNGEERMIAWRNTILRDEAGNITGTLSSGEDITERKRADDKLRDYQKRLKALAAELSIAEEQERRRIAIGIHDNLGQRLAMAKLNLQVLKESVSQPSAKEAIDGECDTMDEILNDIRALTFELSNPVLYEVGLEAAVKSWLENEIRDKTGLEFEFVTAGDKMELDEDIKVVLFQAIRELLTNIVKHAGAGTVKVGIDRHGTEVVVTVEDDGAGFDVSNLGLPSGIKGGFGLFNIRERLEYMGGKMEIASGPGKGTRIVMAVPVKNNEQAAQSKPRQIAHRL